MEVLPVRLSQMVKDARCVDKPMEATSEGDTLAAFSDCFMTCSGIGMDNPQACIP